MAEASDKLRGRKILLCVCGGIAAYKAAELVRRLRDAGATVQVAMTEGALHFVGTPTFQAVSGLPVRTRLWDAAAEAALGHIALARCADRIVVAPATADTLATLPHVLASDSVTPLCLTTTPTIGFSPHIIHPLWPPPSPHAH